MRIAIQGIEGSFHHEAAERLASVNGRVLDLVPKKGFPEVFRAVEEGVDYGLVAIENNVAGPINEVYNLFEQSLDPSNPARKGVWVTSSLRMPIVHNLVGGVANNLAELGSGKGVRVISHEMALKQVSGWLADNLPDAEKAERDDTASSVKEVVESRDPRLLAVAGGVATALHRGYVIEEGIQDAEDNFTRFLLFQRERTFNSAANIGSMIIRAPHKVGELRKILGVFEKSGCNLEMLHSHPVPGARRQYQFFIDYQMNNSNGDMVRQLESNEDYDVRLLGYHSYYEVVDGKVAPGFVAT